VGASTGLASRALAGVRWNYLGAVGRIAATFLSQVLLARLLGPDQFGLFGYAFLTVTLLGLVVEMGMLMALVQTPTLRDEDVAVAMGRLLLAGSVAALGVFLLADVIATRIFSTPQAAPVLRAMAPALLVGAVTAAANAMLSRDLEFKVIQLAGLGSYVIGYLVVGVGAAALGLGVWSLVLAWHAQTLIACIVLLARSPRPMWPANPFRSLPIAGFGGIVMVTNMVNWVIDNGAHTAIGRWLGPSALGLFTISNNLVKVPADHLVKNLQTVLFPLAARAQGNDAGLRRAYLTALAGVGVLSFPVFTYVAVMADPIVALLLGAKWQGAVTVLVPLSLAMILHAVEALCGPILGGRGEPGAELRIKVLMLLLTLGVLAITARWSLAAVAWGVAFVFFARWVGMSAAVAKRLKVSLGLFLRTMAGPALLGAMSWAVPEAVRATLGALGLVWPALGLIASTAVLTTLVIVTATLCLPQWILGHHLLALLHALFEKRPSWARSAGLRRLVTHASSAAVEVAADREGAITPWTRHPKTS